MRLLSHFLVAAICMWLFWHYVLSAIIWSDHGGTHGSGYFPIARLDEIHGFL